MHNYFHVQPSCTLRTRSTLDAGTALGSNHSKLQVKGQGGATGEAIRTRFRRILEVKGQVQPLVRESVPDSAGYLRSKVRVQPLVRQSVPDSAGYLRSKVRVQPLVRQSVPDSAAYLRSKVRVQPLVRESVPDSAGYLRSKVRCSHW